MSKAPMGQYISGGLEPKRKYKIKVRNGLRQRAKHQSLFTNTLAGKKFPQTSSQSHMRYGIHRFTFVKVRAYFVESYLIT